ncbi:MAG: hypothetical protein WCK98_06090 [bacterium]
MILTKTTAKKSFAVPIRLSMEEKYVLEEFSKEANMPLSTYIKSKLKPLMKTRLAKLNKTQILLNQLKQTKIDHSDLEKAMEYGAELRKSLKIRN